MLKYLLYSITFILSIGLTTYHSQNNVLTHELVKGNTYEFTFSSTDYIEVKSNPQFLVNITNAIEVIFNDDNAIILVKTMNILEKNIIYGKFKKQEVKLLTFVKL